MYLGCEKKDKKIFKRYYYIYNETMFNDYIKQFIECISIR